MLDKIKFAVKGIILLGIVSICLFVISGVLRKKEFYNERWVSTTTYNNFYRLPENSVDVIFLGSSRSASTFIPQDLYDDYGITSFNLGNAQQNVLVSYYWLREALRTQSPKAVVLETYVLFDYMPEEALNSPETYTHQAMDFMKWGPVKQEAVRAICALDENQSLSSYYTDFVRYHNRWVELGESDFVFDEMVANPGLKGFSSLTTKENNAAYEFAPYTDGSSDSREEMHPVMLEYFQRMVKLCRDENIDLILLNVPFRDRTIAQYNTLKDYTEQYDLRLLDFNESSVYEDSGFDYHEDMADTKHCNYVGAHKITDYVGKILTEEYGFQSHVDNEWDSGREEYDAVMNSSRLAWTEDFTEYIDRIKNNDRYTIFIAVKGDGTEYITPEDNAKLKELGIQTDMSQSSNCSYCAVISGDEVRECVQTEQVTFQGSLRDGRSNYIVQSSGFDAGDVANNTAVIIDGKDESVNRRGINFVVYDNVMKKVVDAVSFRPKKDQMTAQR